MEVVPTRQCLAKPIADTPKASLLITLLSPSMKILCLMAAPLRLLGNATAASRAGRSSSFYVAPQALKASCAEYERSLALLVTPSRPYPWLHVMPADVSALNVLAGVRRVPRGWWWVPINNSSSWARLR